MMLLGKLILAGLLTAGAGTDLIRRKIPNVLICIGLAAFLVLAGRLYFGGDTAVLTGCLFAGALAFFIHLIPWLMGSMGAGDVKLALIIGLLTGWEEWLGYLGMYCAALLAASAIMLVRGKKRPKTVPLAAVMAAAWFAYYIQRLLPMWRGVS